MYRSAVYPQRGPQRDLITVSGFFTGASGATATAVYNPSGLTLVYSATGKFVATLPASIGNPGTLVGGYVAVQGATGTSPAAFMGWIIKGSKATSATTGITTVSVEFYDAVAGSPALVNPTTAQQIEVVLKFDATV